MNENNERTVVFNAVNGEEQSFVFHRLQNYESVEITISWVGLDEVGGTIKMQEGINDIWVDIPDLDEVMTTADGSTAFQHFDFGNKDVRIIVDFGTGLDGEDDEVVATTGVVTCYLLAKAR